MRGGDIRCFRVVRACVRARGNGRSGVVFVHFDPNLSIRQSAYVEERRSTVVTHTDITAQTRTVNDDRRRGTAERRRFHPSRYDSHAITPVFQRSAVRKHRPRNGRAFPPTVVFLAPDPSERATSRSTDIRVSRNPNVYAHRRNDPPPFGPRATDGAGVPSRRKST